MCATPLLTPCSSVQAFHWQPILPKDIGKTVFANLDDERVKDALKFDSKEFEALFAKKVIQPKAEPSPEEKAGASFVYDACLIPLLAFAQPERRRLRKPSPSK